MVAPAETTEVAAAIEAVKDFAAETAGVTTDEATTTEAAMFDPADMTLEAAAVATVAVADEAAAPLNELRRFR